MAATMVIADCVWSVCCSCCSKCSWERLVSL